MYGTFSELWFLWSFLILLIQPWAHGGEDLNFPGHFSVNTGFSPTMKTEQANILRDVKQRLKFPALGKIIIDLERKTARTQYVNKICQHAWLEWQMLCFAQMENYQMLYLSGRSKPNRGVSDNKLNLSFNAWIVIVIYEGLESYGIASARKFRSRFELLTENAM